MTILSALPPSGRFPKLKELQHDVQIESLKHGRNMFARRTDPDSTFEFFSKALPEMARKAYDDPVIKELYENRHSFDLVVIDAFFNEVR